MYKLELGNDQHWLLIAEDGLQPWLRKFASILRLDSSCRKINPKLVFTRRNMHNADGWKDHDLRSVRFWSHPKVEDIICEIEGGGGDKMNVIRMWQSLYPIYHHAQMSGGLPLHAGLIEKNHQGILLAASGNTGKTTCCRRLPPPWNALSDDEVLIVMDKRKNYSAHPFPTWSDYLWRHSHKTWNVQRCVPLRAIFFLKQAKTDKAIPLGQAEAATFINQLATQILSRSWIGLDNDKQRQLKKTLFDNTCRLAQVVPAFILNFTLKGKFWEKIEKVLEHA